MELRHLRYFIAVAEEGSLTLAAERRLHTAQPSLSRQIRDLEYEVGVQLLIRSARGAELTAAGKAFLDHARLALAQVEAAVEAARRAAQPAKPTFALGFLTGQEMDWLPEAMRILRDQLPNIEVIVSSQYSPDLAQGSAEGEARSGLHAPGSVDARSGLQADRQGVAHRRYTERSSPRVARRDRACRISRAKGSSACRTRPPTLRVIIDDYLERSGLDLKQAHRVDNLAMAMSFIASTRGVALLPDMRRTSCRGR